MSRRSRILIFSLFSLSFLSSAPAWADDLPDSEALERLVHAPHEAIMPQPPVPEPGKVSTPRGRMVSLDLRTGELSERDGSPLERLLDRAMTEGSMGAIAELYESGESQAQKNFSGWSLVNDPSTGNYQRRVKLWMGFTNNNGMPVTSGCSGTLLDPYHVLTAAHCIYSWSIGNNTIQDWADTITVAAGYSGSNFPTGIARASALHSWTGWTQNNDVDHDIGIITLDRPIGLLTGWYGYGYDEDCDYFESGGWHMAGYPGEAPFDGTLMYEASGNFDECPMSGWDDQVLWNMGSSGGLSGSGAQRNGYIFGVASTSDRTSISTICRLTEGKFDDIGFWLDNETPNSPDVLPMTVQAPAAVSQGDAIASFGLVFGNTAKVSAFGTWNYEMYLSTDPNINSSDILIDTGSFSQSLPPRGTAWVNLPTPVISSFSVPAGNYRIGIVITNSDANVSNNDSSGQDSAPITVLCPSQASTPPQQIPGNGESCIEPEEVWIQWGSVGSYAQYQLQIGTAPNTGNLYLMGQTHYVATQLSESETYYWRVRARRGCGPWSSWSGTRSFSTVIDEYTYSDVVSPTDGEHCTASGGTMLEWEPLPQASYYEVQISDNWCYEGTIYSPAGTQLYLSNLTPNTTYYWRVRAMTSCGSYTNWSSVPGFCWTFKTAPTPGLVAAPSLTWPLDGSSCESPDPYLLWAHAEDWDFYDVQVGTSCGNGPISQTSANGFQLNGLLDNTIYHWRVRVTQECGESSGWTACRTFTVDDVAPTNPTTIASNSHTVATWSSDDTVDLWWDLGNDACSGWVNYGTVWDDSPNTIPEVFDNVWDPESTYETSPQLADGIHWFHLRAIDMAQNLADDALHFGPIWIDANPPTTPVVSANLPLSEWVSAASIEVNWTSTDAGSGVDHYLVAFDQSSSTVPTSSTQQDGITWAINGDGPWYAHVIAVDGSAQQSAVTHHGPFFVDNTAPNVSAQFPDSDNPANAGDTVEILISVSNKLPEGDLYVGELKLSLDGGQSFEDVVDVGDSQVRSGRVYWQVPAVSTSQAVLRLCVRDRAGNEGQDQSGAFLISGAVGLPDQAPTRLALLGNYPNPFNPRTTIQYSLDRPTHVRLSIYDPRGRLVRGLVDTEQLAGAHDQTWDGTDQQGRFVPSGVYFYRLQAGDLDDTRRMVLVK